MVVGTRNKPPQYWIFVGVHDDEPCEVWATHMVETFRGLMEVNLGEDSVEVAGKVTMKTFQVGKSRDIFNTEEGFVLSRRLLSAISLGDLAGVLVFLIEGSPDLDGFFFLTSERVEDCLDVSESVYADTGYDDFPLSICLEFKLKLDFESNFDLFRIEGEEDVLLWSDRIVRSLLNHGVPTDWFEPVG